MKNFLFIVLLLSASGYAGSRFGFQTITFGNLNTQYSASGAGRSYELAHMDSLQMNFKNPSLWTGISKTTLSINGNYNAYFSENNIETSYSNNSSFEGAFIGIPLIPRTLSFGVGLQPFSFINQKLSSNIPGFGNEVEQDIILNGGLSKAGFNFAYKINDKISAAFGYEFTFGRLDETGVFSDSTGSLFNLAFEKQVKSSGLVFSFTYSPISELKLGLVVKPSLKGTYKVLAKTVSLGINEETESDFYLPTELNIGAEYRLSERYYTGFDLLYQDWNKGFKVDNNRVEGYSNFYYFGLGIERKGSPRQFVRYLEQIDLRAGLFYKNLSQTNNFNEVTEIGMSLGVTLPIQRFKSKIDLAGFISKRGDLKTNALEETIVGLKFSISSNEIWFVNIED